VCPFDGRRIPVITDGLLVDMALGTGAVKVTPAHDENDFKCGKRHGLPFLTVIAEDGRMAASCPAPFAGMMRYDARYAICKALETMGLMRGKADNKMALSVCSRTGDVIEPLMKPQWYVRCDGMAKRAADAVRSGELTIVPDIHHGVWFHYMDNIRDWCVSRQLWWGHRIPAYFATVEAGARAPGAPEPEEAQRWFVARSEEEARAQAAARFGVAPAAVRLAQDEDVLDTWFSSGLFPFSTFGWPDEQHADFKAFYPNSLLETGHDILFFWVARMVMMGQQLTGKLPFRTVYLHAMVRDKEGRKMSKSKGNVIDPMEVIYGCDLETLHQKVRDGNLPAKEVELAIKGQRENFPDGLPECGADALRFGCVSRAARGSGDERGRERAGASASASARAHAVATRPTPLVLTHSRIAATRLQPAGLHGAGARHQPGRRPRRGLPAVLQQALERDSLRAHAPSARPLLAGAAARRGGRAAGEPEPCGARPLDPLAPQRVLRRR
jgi:valyl-tRNA synthetase